ncbi:MULTISPECIES: CPXCG motif-containing cysteine-rich protein [Hwangdonia]|uniref:CPXCG motif-containing cysteine-rich protein n=1 Tax=Hwangdonia seohaensis TaxID=1240727 RepID=A0ABW3RCW5_9FLAO|nr:CPXCG motif-containing cysteine-rich protein [Hwangdonia seohaensis]
MKEHYFTCPHCWENISMLLDSSIANQKYIEDCEVCCNPIQVSVQFSNSELIHFQADSIGQ